MTQITANAANAPAQYFHALYIDHSTKNLLSGSDGYVSRGLLRFSGHRCALGWGGLGVGRLTRGHGQHFWAGWLLRHSLRHGDAAALASLKDFQGVFIVGGENRQRPGRSVQLGQQPAPFSAPLIAASSVFG